MNGFELLASSASGGAARFELRVPRGSPFFAGHFPGEPILPAVAQLDLAEALAQELLGFPAALHSIDLVRFRSPIQPGDAITLELALAPDPPAGSDPGATGRPTPEPSAKRDSTPEPGVERDPVPDPAGIPAGSSAVRLSIQRAGGSVTAGLLRFLPLDGAWLTGARPTGARPTGARPTGARPVTDGSGQPPRPGTHASDADEAALRADFLPHAFPARLIERVLERGERASLCLARVPPASPFARPDGRFPAHLALELGAQAAAAAESLARALAEPPDPSEPSEPSSSPARPGFLVTARRARFHAPSFPLAAAYHVRAELVRAAPPLRTWSITILLAGTPLATCELGTYAR